MPDPAIPTSWDGVWRNEVGSEMTLRETGGIVAGTYRTRVGRPEDTESFALVGIARDDMIAWTVDFGDHGSLTAWTGRRIDDDDPRIATLWHLVRNRDDAGEPLAPWASTLAGAAVFRRPD